MLVEKTACYERDELRLDKHLYAAAITKLSGAGSSFTRHYLARGGAENCIEEFKSGFGAAHMPSQSFHVNWFWLLIAALAYNLANALKFLLLPAADRAQQQKELRLRWCCVAARWIRSGRRSTLALARGPDKVDAIDELQRRFVTL